MSLDVSITCNCQAYRHLLPLSRQELLLATSAMHNALQDLPCGFEQRIELILGSDALLEEMNSRFLGEHGVHGPTNTLAFPGSREIAGAMKAVEGMEAVGDTGAMKTAAKRAKAKNSSRGKPWGQVYFSLQTYYRECVIYGQDKKEHALRLLAHAIAHLAGYDHGPDMDFLCWKLQNAALLKLEE